ncbi:MAG: ATP-binding cassette domain-containing protein [Candidatus Bathyarchaeia archaeon]|jgi:ABC-type ATPase with predicted acetyltransferase domain|nr:ATP-binding cassette domain-containing protein [Candidatus Bathyarchaeota archaeon A05DMB-4]MDH7595064.1 ATP-binding cassette domain-containing protein [Candidatus Bathyarchaeota archaeon]
MKREFFKIIRSVKKFNRDTKKFCINISYETATTLTPRTLAVSEAFGLGVDASHKQVLYDNVELQIGPTDIFYITGESGSGKSVLLTHLEKLLQPNAINVQDVKFDASKPVIETIGRTFEEGLTLLCKVGLNDAFIFLRPYNQLSDGQKYRYRLAKLIETGKQFWIMDEFCSTLDRDTAKIVAYNVQKHARQTRKAVLAATTHIDLLEDLAPTLHVHKRFGKEITIKYFPNMPPAQCTIAKHTRIIEGTILDYHKLSQFHYRESRRLPPPRKIFTMQRTDMKELVGVIVYSYPPPTCFGRKKALAKQRLLTMKEMNQQLSIISRVVLHPKYRTIGLGARLVKETLPLVGTPYVEAVAVMAKYNPFFEKAGMIKFATQHSDASCKEAIQSLSKIGFNPHLIASEKYNQEKLENLNKEQINEIKSILGKIKNHRLRRIFANKPYINNKAFQTAITNTNLTKLTKALHILSILLQEKIYLFWTRTQQ